MTTLILVIGDSTGTQARPTVPYDLLAVSDTGLQRDAGGSMKEFEGGCHDVSSFGGLETALEIGFGPLGHFDGVLPVDLGDGRSIWFVQDGLFDWKSDGPALTFREMQYTNNAAIVFGVDGCAQVLLDGPNANGRFGFELTPTPDDVRWQQFYWPLAAIVENGALSVTWAEMRHSDRQPTIYDGIARHPGPTFVATYDLITFERLSWKRFPDLVLGFGFWASPGSDGWVYHFGNRNLLNLAMNDGYGNGPHPATKTYLGRGKTLAHGVSEVWDGDGWTGDLEKAAPIYQEGWAATMLRPVQDRQGRWVTALKQEEFWGTAVDVLAADEPFGPWGRVGKYEMPNSGSVPTVTYHASILSTSSCAASLLISGNAAIWEEAIAQPDLYRVFAFPVDTC